MKNVKNFLKELFNKVNKESRLLDEEWKCDVCGVVVPDYDPWHFSTKESRHNHACNECWEKMNN